MVGASLKNEEFLLDVGRGWMQVAQRHHNRIANAVQQTDI